MERVRFHEDHCKGCGLCTSVCPKNIIFLAEGFNRQGYHPATVTDQEACISCTLCAIICPDLVIEVFRPIRDAARGNGVAREAAVGGGATLG